MKKIVLILLLTLLLPACAHRQGLGQMGMKEVEEPKSEYPGERVEFKKLDPKIREALNVKRGDLVIKVKEDASIEVFFLKNKNEFKEGRIPLNHKLKGFIQVFSVHSNPCKSLDVSGKTYWYPAGCP